MAPGALLDELSGLLADAWYTEIHYICVLDEHRVNAICAYLHPQLLPELSRLPCLADRLENVFWLHVALHNHLLLLQIDLHRLHTCRKWKRAMEGFSPVTVLLQLCQIKWDEVLLGSLTWLAGENSPHSSLTPRAGHGHLQYNLQGDEISSCQRALMALPPCCFMSINSQCILQGVRVVEGLGGANFRA